MNGYYNENGYGYGYGGCFPCFPPCFPPYPYPYGYGYGYGFGFDGDKKPDDTKDNRHDDKKDKKHDSKKDKKHGYGSNSNLSLIAVLFILLIIIGVLFDGQA